MMLAALTAITALLLILVLFQFDRTDELNEPAAPAEVWSWTDSLDRGGPHKPAPTLSTPRRRQRISTGQGFVLSELT